MALSKYRDRKRRLILGLTIASSIAIPVSKMEVPSVHCSAAGKIEHYIIIPPIRGIFRKRVKALEYLHLTIGEDPDVVLSSIGATSHVAISVSITCRACTLATKDTEVGRNR